VVSGVVALVMAATPLLAQGSIRSHPIASQNIFPLQPGNTWTYERRGRAGSAEWTVEVVERVAAPRVMPYVLLDGYFQGPPRTVRSDPFGSVTERSAGFRDLLWYLLGAPIGTSWTFQLAPSPDGTAPTDCVNGARLTLAARDEKLSVPAGEFTGVVRVDWVSPCADAGIASEWFAPGVGLIRRDEVTIAGIVTSELVRAEVGGRELPKAAYTTTLTLDRSLYVNNLMPPVGPEAIPTVAGSLALKDRSHEPATLVFSGCKSVVIEVIDEAGEVVLTARSDDGGCCSCDNLVEWDLGAAPLVVPFTFKLQTAAGQPLADGRYAVSAELETSGPEPVRPAARAVIDVTSVH